MAGPNGCHVCTYSTGSHGYAQAFTTKVTVAHRVAWEAVNGSIPEGMTIDHGCRNRRCVNVRHMRLLSNFENARRTHGRDWPLGYCINGHPNERLHRTNRGRLECQDCRPIWAAAKR